MNLFELNNWKLQIQPEAYALIPFKTLITRDKTKGKEMGIKELSFVFYMADYKSDFVNILNIKERTFEVKRHLGLPKDWNPDKAVEEAIQFYKDNSRTTKLILLEDARGGIHKLSAYIRDINFDDVEHNVKTGEVKPKHDIKKFADTMRLIPNLIETLDKCEEAVKKEEQTEKGLRGGRTKGLYAD